MTSGHLLRSDVEPRTAADRRSSSLGCVSPAKKKTMIGGSERTREKDMLDQDSVQRSDGGLMFEMHCMLLASR